MKLFYLNAIVLSVCFILSCNNTHPGSVVTTEEELNEALKAVEEGSAIVLSNGEWKDINIKFYGIGTEKKPIILKAETPGKVFLTGQSSLQMGGEYLEVDGLYFKDGFTQKKAVVEFRLNKDTLANHCRLTNLVIEDYNQLQRDRQDLWVLFHGRHNQMDHSYLAGKSNQGPTLRISIAGNQSINNYHNIIHNHFGPRPRKGGPKAETIQIGDSYTSMSPSYTNISNNLFEKCNGEVEVISSKTNFNEFRNNIFYKCEGSLVTRHGNYCTIDGNMFIGDGTRNVGGVRIINTGHKVVNNYFYNLSGVGFLSPLAIMNGIPKSPLNRYNQVTDVVIAYNTWVDCKSPWHFGIGSNVDQKDVLPLSEIRSAIPKRTTVANNLIYNSIADSKPIVAHDKLDGISFKQNLINNQGKEFEERASLQISAFEVKETAKDMFVPIQTGITEKVYQGFEFDKIENDLLGASRKNDASFGATISGSSFSKNEIINYKDYGPSWFDSNKEIIGNSLTAYNEKELIQKMATALEGDTIILSGKEYTFNKSLEIDKHIVLQSSKRDQKVTLHYSGAKGSPLFELNPKGNLTLDQLNLKGSGDNYLFAPLQKGMSSLYNLQVTNCDISTFDYVLKGYKESFANEILFAKCNIEFCNNGIELSAEKNNKGDYNVEFLSFVECTFKNISKNVIDFYRGGYDESTIGGNLLVDNCKFQSCGKMEENGTLINSHGIVNVTIQHSSFINNAVQYVAFLWGAKNNNHIDNTISNSGKIKVEENLKQSLMY